tara:strand:- start:179 stop:784 length:606 start_codon:yes stop_codon:yes gene_type:complete
MKIFGTAKGGALSKKDFGVAFSKPAEPVQVCNNCEEGVNCDTVAVNPDTNDRRKYGYKLLEDASVIGKALTQVTLRLTNTASSVGTIGIYVYDASEDDNTKVGTLDVSTFSGSSYADFEIECSDSPTLEENDIIYWENDANRDSDCPDNCNINSKQRTNYSEPTNYAYYENASNTYGTPPTATGASISTYPNMLNMCFTAT